MNELISALGTACGCRIVSALLICEASHPIFANSLHLLHPVATRGVVVVARFDIDCPSAEVEIATSEHLQRSEKALNFWARIRQLRNSEGALKISSEVRRVGTALTHLRHWPRPGLLGGGLASTARDAGRLFLARRRICQHSLVRWRVLS